MVRQRRPVAALGTDTDLPVGGCLHLVVTLPHRMGPQVTLTLPDSTFHHR